jgi:hypothetical protein
MVLDLWNLKFMPSYQTPWFLEIINLQSLLVMTTSNFQIILIDGRVFTENWSDISIEKTVKYGKGTKIVFVCKFPAKQITINHEELTTNIDIPENCEVYQSIRGETLFLPDGTKKNKIAGRTVGLVKNGEIIEERFLDSSQNIISGFKI